MAAKVAARLGVPSPAAMDVNVVCAGFTHALATADHAVRAGAATRALVIGADKMSEVTDWSDRTTCVLVGDGGGRGGRGRRSRHRARHRAGAVGIGARDGARRTHRGHAPAVRAGGAERLPLGRRHGSRRSPGRPASGPGLSPEELAAVVLHQANLRIIEPLAAKIGAVNAVVARDVVDSGNTSAASIRRLLQARRMRLIPAPATRCSSSASAATSRTRDRSSAAPDVRGRPGVTRPTLPGPGHGAP